MLTAWEMKYMSTDSVYGSDDLDVSYANSIECYAR